MHHLAVWVHTLCVGQVLDPALGDDRDLIGGIGGMSKETYPYGKETYYMAKETYLMAKETYYMAKETYYMAKETYYMAKETY